MTLLAEGVTAGYGARAILRDVSCSVEPGRFTVVLGPNGSGKSTLLKTLVRALPPSAGRVLLEGKEVYRMRPREISRLLAYVPQETPAGFSFTVREMVALGHRPAASPQRETVDRALSTLDLLPLAGRSLTALSGGELQRAAIARALAQETPYLLLDEPTAHLDLRHRLHLLQALRRQAQGENAALLAVLHDLNLAAAYADRLLLLHHGEVVAEGAPQDVLTPAILRDVYETNVLVKRHPATGRPWVLAASTLTTNGSDRPAAGAVHILCGGGTGTPLMASLNAAGVRVTAGVLSPLDSDAETATALGIPYTEDAPFSPIGPEALARDAVLIDAARYLVVADFPVGSGNRALLEAALRAARGGKSVIAVGAENFESRDYTQGDALPLWTELQRHVRGAASPEDVVELVLEDTSV